MWLILGCSVFSLGIFLERLLHFHRATFDVPGFLKGVVNATGRGDISAAEHEAGAAPGPVGRVALAILQHPDLPRQDLRDIAQEAAQLEVPGLERNLRMLSTIAFATPMLGLLGTVLGLLQTFDLIAAGSGGATAIDIAKGVYWSLLTSAASLAVAVPAFVAHGYLSSRVDRFLGEMERVGIELLSALDMQRSSKQ